MAWNELYPKTVANVIKGSMQTLKLFYNPTPLKTMKQKQGMKYRTIDCVCTESSFKQFVIKLTIKTILPTPGARKYLEYFVSFFDV